MGEPKLTLEELAQQVSDLAMLVEAQNRAQKFGFKILREDAFWKQEIKDNRYQIGPNILEAIKQLSVSYDGGASMALVNEANQKLALAISKDGLVPVKRPGFFRRLLDLFRRR